LKNGGLSLTVWLWWSESEVSGYLKLIALEDTGSGS